MQRTSSPTLTNTTQPNPGVGGDAPIVYPLTLHHPSPAYSCCSLLLYRVSWHHDAESGQFLKVCCRILSFSCPLPIAHWSSCPILNPQFYNITDGSAWKLFHWSKFASTFFRPWMSTHRLRNMIFNECLSYEKNVLSSVDTHTTQAQSIIHTLGFLIPLRKKAITRECRQQGK